MAENHRIQLPASEADITRLKVGDLVVLDGEITTTAGLPTHHRIMEAIGGERDLPFPLDGAALCHLGSYSEDQSDGSFRILYMNPTTSTRFNPLMPRIIRHFGLRIVMGKGGLDRECAKAMQDVGCVYLSILGGGAPLHSDAIREVVDLGWDDLVAHYRLVRIRVEGLGPLTVGIDAHGNNGFLDRQEKAMGMIPELMAQMKATRGD